MHAPCSGDLKSWRCDVANCKNISPPKRKLCAGALRTNVGLYSRDLTHPAFGSQDNRQTYTLIDTLPAAPQTINGIDIFDSIEKSGSDGIPSVATILFFVRYRTDVTAENFLQHDGVNYQILRVEPLDLRKEYLKIFAAARGDLNLEAAR